MPQKKNYVRYFTAMTLGVKKKITQLLNYVRPLSPTAVGEMQERMLMDLTHQLQESIDHLQLTWLEKRDEVLQPNLDTVSNSMASTVATGEAALRKAERFFVLGNKGRSPIHPSSDLPIDKPDRLDNTLRPAGTLTQGMLLEEAQHWLRKFDQWFKWNTTVLSKKDNVTQRLLLENFLDESMLSRIKSDITVTDAMPIQGPNGLLAKLESYYTDDLPMIIRRHNFISCKQERGEKFLAWVKNVYLTR